VIQVAVSVAFNALVVGNVSTLPLDSALAHHAVGQGFVVNELRVPSFVSSALSFAFLTCVRLFLVAPVACCIAFDCTVRLSILILNLR